MWRAQSRAGKAQADQDVGKIVREGSLCRQVSDNLPTGLDQPLLWQSWTGRALRSFPTGPAAPGPVRQGALHAQGAGCLASLPPLAACPSSGSCGWPPVPTYCMTSEAAADAGAGQPRASWRRHSCVISWSRSQGRCRGPQLFQDKPPLQSCAPADRVPRAGWRDNMGLRLSGLALGSPAAPVLIIASPYALASLHEAHDRLVRCDHQGRALSSGSH